MKKMIKDTVWKISIIDKYGRNVVLVNQPKEPTQAQLDRTTSENQSRQSGLQAKGRYQIYIH